MAKQRISYFPLDKMDAEMQKEMDRCRREGTPRPESSAVRAHVPACFWFFANSWNDIFRNGIVDHSLKELCRVYVSRSVKCEYCGNQRSVKGAKGKPADHTNCLAPQDILHGAGLPALRQIKLFDGGPRRDAVLIV